MLSLELLNFPVFANRTLVFSFDQLGCFLAGFYSVSLILGDGLYNFVKVVFF